MAILNVSLKNVITGSKQKYFILDVLDNNNVPTGETKVYIANIEKNDSINNIITNGSGILESQFANKCNLIDTANNTLIKNMYDINDVNDMFKSRSYAFVNKKNITLTNADDYSDLYISHDYNAVDMTGFNDSLYILTNKITSATYYYMTRCIPISFGNFMQYTETIADPIYTAILPSSSELEAVSDKTKQFTEKYIPSKYVDGIEYNHLIEYPTSIYPLFTENTLLGNVVIAKNHLGYDYDQHSDITRIANFNRRTFNELRSYKRLISSGDNLFLIYSNDTSATTQQYNDADYTIIGITETSTVNLDEVSATDFTSNNDTVRNYATGKIEKVETIQSINRFSPTNSHKSNLYSIEISDLGINELEKTNDEAMKKTISNIKKSINNGIRKLCKKIQPGNTQLFSVLFTGN